MAEVGLTQLQMMLVRQGGFGTLPLSILPAGNFLSFIRAAEQLCLDEKLNPVIVYWSKHNAEALLPESARLKQLADECKCLSIFSGGNLEAADEWCVLIESNKLSMVVHGQECNSGGSRYQCAGSMDTELVKQYFARLLPKLQAVDPVESNKLEDARAGLTYGDSVVALTQRLKSRWPIIKSPSRQNFVVTPAVQYTSRPNIILKSSSDYKPVPGASQTRHSHHLLSNNNLVLNRGSQIWVKQILNRVLLLLTQVVSRLHTVEQLPAVLLCQPDSEQK